MKLEIGKDTITLERDLTELDRFTLDFIKILDTLSISYVLVSGYVTILFGRSRTSEDVDMFIELLSPEKVSTLWDAIAKDFESVNITNAKDAYSYLTGGLGVRFFQAGAPVPNIEVKFPKKETDFWSLHHRKKVIFNGIPVYIGPMELQIVYKLDMGSEKDIEDARHLYNLWKNHLNQRTFQHFLHKFNKAKEFTFLIWKPKQTPGTFLK